MSLGKLLAHCGLCCIAVLIAAVLFLSILSLQRTLNCCTLYCIVFSFSYCLENKDFNKIAF